MIVVVAAVLMGLFLIGFLSRFAINVPRVDTRSKNEKPDSRPPIPPQEFEYTIRRLLEALRLDVVSVSTEEEGVLAMTCRDPRPVVGGKLLVRAKRLTVGGQVDAAEVLAFADNVRGDTGTLKGIDIAAAGFTDEAYTAANAAPAVVELIDAARLVDLVREYVPERAALLESYQPFRTGARRHRRATWSDGAGTAPDLLPQGGEPMRMTNANATTKGLRNVTTFIKDNALIVVGVDYSQNSNDALDAAAGLVGASADVAIHLVHVMRSKPTDLFGGMPRPFADPPHLASADDDRAAEEKELVALTERMAASSTAKGARLFGHLRAGHPAREIVQLASDLSADLVVVGTHGRTGVMKLLLGSVAQTVLTNSSCPVLVVKPKGFPMWPAIEPPCAECVAVQRSSDPKRLWCQRHSRHHPSAHTYFDHSATGYGLGAQTFRGMG